MLSHFFQSFLSVEADARAALVKLSIISIQYNVKSLFQSVFSMEADALAAQMLSHVSN